jgi:phenylalanyl-tRNA synthetase beta subunit
MAEMQMTVTAEEKQFLESFLEATLKDKRVEEHRTRTPSYRKDVLHEEDVIVALLAKLRKLSS